MEISFFDVLITVLSLILLAVPGFIFAKLKMLPEKASETISTIVLYGSQTLLVITGFQSQPFRSNIAVNMLIVFGLAVVIHLIMIGLVYLFTLKLPQEAKIRCVRYTSIFSNCGFMGVPFLQSLFTGTEMLGEVLIYGAVIISVFNILNWTLGVFIITGDKKLISVKKILLNPVIIAVVVGLILFVTVKTPFKDLAPQGGAGDKIIEKIMESIGSLSNMVTPLSMTVIGIKLANVSLKQLFLDKWAYLSAALKLIGMSLISMLAVAFLPVAETVKYTVFFLLSMPSATSSAMLAVQFGGDSDTASVIVLLTTILSVLTIPLMFLLFVQII